MKAPELFGVVIRTAGFLIVLYGLWEVWGGVETVTENLFSISQGDNGDQTSSFSFFADGVPALIVGVLVFFLADLIVRLAYGRAHS